MAKIIIHIGDGKCGSTAIQLALHNSHKDLRELGILYETGDGRKSHVTLPLLIGYGNRARNNDMYMDSISILSSLRHCHRDYDWIIISGENIVHNNPEDFISLLSLSFDGIDELRVISYVREPQYMYGSILQQSLKGGHHYIFPDKYNHDIVSAVSNWKNYLGKENFKVKLFSKNTLVNGDVVADFEEFINEVTGKCVKLPKVAPNKSMTAEQACAMQAYRRSVFPSLSGKVNSESKILSKLFDELNEISILGNKIEISELAKSVISWNNRKTIDFINELNPHSGDRLTYEKCSYVGTFPWRENDSVHVVMQNFSNHIFLKLCSIIPGMAEDDIEMDNAATVFGDIYQNDSKKMSEAYEAYRRYCSRLSNLKNS